MVHHIECTRLEDEVSFIWSLMLNASTLVEVFTHIRAARGGFVKNCCPYVCMCHMSNPTDLERSLALLLNFLSAIVWSYHRSHIPRQWLVMSFGRSSVACSCSCLGFLVSRAFESPVHDLGTNFLIRCTRCLFVCDVVFHFHVMGDSFRYPTSLRASCAFPIVHDD